ncbi:MAG: DNA cytosine methyltransferase, partial [Planctomycetota bacterium]
MTIGSLFSGIGGLELGLERGGLGPVVWQVETDPFCRAVLAKHWPDADRSVTDVRKANRTNLTPVDLVCGGFPCQDVSSAGKGAGLAGSRSGLWFEFHRILWHLQPRWVVVENVASAAVRWVDDVMEGLDQLGYTAVPFPLSAEDVGAWHLRRRIFVVAILTSEPIRPARFPWEQRRVESATRDSYKPRRHTRKGPKRRRRETTVGATRRSPQPGLV